MITNNLFIKYQKGIKRGIIIGIVMLLLGIGVILVGGMRQVENEENALYFNDILEGDGEKVGKFSYLNVTGDAYMFAQYGDNDDYCYFVYDDQYYYIIRMSEKEYNKLFNKGDSVVRVEGTVSKIDEDIRRLAIDGFNEYYEEDVVNLVNFEDYFGDVYLNLNISTSSDASIIILIGFVIFFIGLCIFIINLIRNVRIKKSLNKLTDMEKSYIDSELNSSSCLVHKKYKLFLANSYIVNFAASFFIVKYSDIIWMYTHEQFYNGIKTNKHIKVMLKNGKTYILCSGNSKKHDEVLESVWSIIVNKNPYMLLGFTSENQAKAKQYVNNNKMQ